MTAATLTLRAPWRCHMRLEGRSPLTKLIRHGSYVLPDPGFIPALHRDLAGLLEDDPGRIALDTLTIERAEGAVVLPVDMRNTQFIAADRLPGVFPDGYEPDILGLMDVLLGDGDGFLDLGANWGYMTLHALLRPGYRGKVVAVEPGRRPRGDLNRLLAACGLADRAAVYGCAIGARDGSAVLSRPPWSGQASIVGTTEGETVAVRSVDSLRLPAARLVKVDIEGAEADFLRGARGYIERHRPAIVFENRLDAPGGSWAGPFHILAGFGYACYAVAATVEREGETGGAVRLDLADLDASNRAAFPLHLNALAVASPAVIEQSPFRARDPAP
jgi:FkbM family methyltransferase